MTVVLVELDELVLLKLVELVDREVLLIELDVLLKDVDIELNDVEELVELMEVLLTEVLEIELDVELILVEELVEDVEVLLVLLLVELMLLLVLLVDKEVLLVLREVEVELYDVEVELVLMDEIEVLVELVLELVEEVLEVLVVVAITQAWQISLSNTIVYCLKRLDGAIWYFVLDFGMFATTGDQGRFVYDIQSITTFRTFYTPDIKAITPFLIGLVPIQFRSHDTAYFFFILNCFKTG